jgi:hypothetical protein
MTSLVSASTVTTGQVQSLDSVRAHALPSDAMIFASATKVQPANQNPGSYVINDQVSGSTPTINGSVPAVTLSPFADLYKEGSVYIDGVAADYISTALTGYTMSQGISMEMFVNYQNFTNSTYTIGFMAPSAATYNFTLGVNGSAAPIVTWTGGTLVSSVTVSANTWNHLACSWDGTTLRLYVNGALGNSTTSFTPPTLAQNFLIGRANSLTCTAYVTDVRIVTNPAVYTGSTLTVPSAPLSPAAAGTTNFMMRVGQNSPTIQSGALTFDRGLKQYMNFGPLTFNMYTRGFACVFRFQFNGAVPSYGYDRIFNAATSSSQTNAIQIFRDSTNAGIGFNFFLNGSQAFYLATPSTIAQNQSYVATVMYNPTVSSGTASIWINGVQVASSTGLNSSIGSTDPTIMLFNTIGAGPGLGQGAPLNASINVLAVYNRALSNTEIYNSYLALSATPQQVSNTTVEFGDVNGTPALSIAGDGRVNVTKLGQTSNVLPWPPAAMTGYVSSINGGTYVASASTEASPAWQAMDKNTTTGWVNAGTPYNTSAPYNYTGTVTTTDVNGTVYPGEWLQIQLPVPVTLNNYQLSTSTSNYTTQVPGKWAVLGSRDGVNWTLVDSRASFTSWTQFTYFTFNVSAGQAYSYYRIVVAQSLGIYNVVIGEFVLNGTADTAQQLTVAQPMTLSYGAQTASLTGIANAGVYAPQDFSSSGLNIPAYVVSNTATVANTVQYSSFGPFAGEGSFQFNGNSTTTGASIQFPASVNSVNSNIWSFGAWTIELWMYPYYNNNAINGYPNIISQTNGYNFGWDVNNVLKFTYGTAGTSGAYNGSPIYNSWQHIALTYDGTSIRLFQNGSLLQTNSSLTASSFTFTSANYTFIGATPGTTNQYLPAYISNMRLVYGQCMYAAAFTPPTGPLQPVQGVNQAGRPYGTVLLLRNAPAPGRVLTSKFGGANSGGVLAFPPSAMTGYATLLNSGYGQGPYVATSSGFNGTNGPWFSFDKIGNTQWETYPAYSGSPPYGVTTGTVTTDVNGNSYAGEWIQIQTPSAIVLSGYQMQGSYYAQIQSPAKWWILGSRDGTSWNLVDARSGATNFTIGTYAVPSSQAFTYYRLVVNQLQGAGVYGHMTDWTLNGTIEGPNVTADGRLGVGVSAPTQALEVAGNMVTGGTVSSGTGLMFRNALYNGDFRIAQRGTSFVNPNGTYTLDRWYINSGTGCTVSQVQSGLQNFSNAIQIQTSTTTTQNIYLSQSLETRDVIRFQGQTVTLSFWYRIPTSFTGGWSPWVWSSTATDTRVSDIGSGTGLGNGLTINTTAWTYAQFSVFVPTTVNSMSVMFLNFNNVVNGATIQITGVQLEKGTLATPFEVRPYGVELQLCQRYYEKSYSNVVAPGTNTSSGYVEVYGASDGSSNFVYTQRYCVPKRIPVNPTFYQIGGTSGSWNYSRSGASGTSGATYSGAGENSWHATFNVGATFAPCVVYGQWTADAEL